MVIRALKWLLMFGTVFYSPPGISSAQDKPIPPVELRVMTFNIWSGGDLVDFRKVVEVIQAADADIVGLQEATGNTRRLVDALGDARLPPGNLLVHLLKDDGQQVLASTLFAVSE